MFTNSKASEMLAILATIDPASQSAGSATTGWVSVANHHGLLAVVQTGVLGTLATVDAKLQQATDSTGAGAKDVAGRAITQIVKATGDNKQALINLKPEDLDTVNGFGFVRVALTVGVAASITGAQLLGVNPRFAPADTGNQAAVVQVV
jgi:hypothetical protein